MCSAVKSQTFTILNTQKNIVNFYHFKFNLPNFYLSLTLSHRLTPMSMTEFIFIYTETKDHEGRGRVPYHATLGPT